jgi:predicted metal-dependent enzyme (double-stranded beta helix superfamily)
MPNHQRFRDFVARFTSLVDAGADEPRIFDEGGALLADLVSHDDWLPDECAVPVPGAYRQYLLHCDPRERFSVVSFVWAPGVKTPIHDHTVWGMVGVMRGAELCHEFAQPADGPVRATGTHLCKPGDVDLVSPTVGDVHVVENALGDAPSISIHVYGANIGAVHRHVFTPEGEVKPFVSGYSNTQVPNFWDRSKDAR